MNPPWPFAADGDGYERLMGRRSRRLAVPFLDFVGAADDERVLDVGCGTGNLAFAVAERSAASTVHAIDLASSYIEHARRHHRHARIRFEVGDASALDLPDRSFDRVLSLLVLHFLPRADAAIAAMRRVAKPGGTVGAAVWDARGGFVGNRIFCDTAAALDPDANAHRTRSYTRPMTRPGELAQSWRDAGFGEVVAPTLCIRMEFMDFADYWRPYTGTDGPGAAHLKTPDERGCGTRSARRISTARTMVRVRMRRWPGR